MKTDEMNNLIRKTNPGGARRIQFKRTAKRHEQLSGFSGKLAIQSFKRLDLVRIASILYCQASGNYTKVVMEDGRTFLMSGTLKSTEELLQSSGLFSRLHQTYLVNCQFIEGIDKSQRWHAELCGGVRIPVSRSGRAILAAITKH
ncbi:MAG: LytTR family DNA-binding domain-containing protein [Saprospiraceae bacterium]|nr:LytTR family DNA-binding domain-containing protein [Saprospiraceae bacterium]